MAAFDPTTGAVNQTTSSLDQEKFLAAKLLERSYLRLVAASVSDKVSQPKGTGKTAFFVRYKRMNVPVNTLTEGVPPTNSTFALEQVTVSLDQWGDLITITDVAVLTTSHPLFQQAMDLLLDNANRLQDREAQNTWLTGTNVMYGDGTVTARANITAAMKISDDIIQKARVLMLNAGAPPFNGPTNMMMNARGKQATPGSINSGSNYVAICGPEVLADIQRGPTTNMWVAVAQYQNGRPIFNGEVGQYYGIRWVETNFIPKFQIFGDTTTASALGANAGTTGFTTAATTGGSLVSATTYFWKIVKKDLLRGFAEYISIAHSTSPGGSNTVINFTAPATAGFVYDLYFGTAGTDANLGLVQSNIAAGATASVTAVPATTTNPPPNVNTTGTPNINPVFIFGKSAVAWVGLQNLQTFVTGEKAEKADPLAQFRTMSYKYMGKNVILDQTRLLRLELVSNFG